MCGRYTLSTPGDRLQEVFGLNESVELEPRFNIAPTQRAPIVRPGGAGRPEISLLRWGLVPHWARDPTIGSRLINARAETVDRKPAFRDSFAARRCLVPADGFYEWTAVGQAKQPFFFSRSDGEPFAMAGVWARWGRGPESLESFALITTEANGLVRRVHDRMPAILAPEDWEAWLLGGADDLPGQLARLRPAPVNLLRSYPVGTYVNSPANDSSRCVEAVDPDEPESSGPSAQSRLF